jgi:hypothetical protein
MLDFVHLLNYHYSLVALINICIEFYRLYALTLLSVITHQLTLSNVAQIMRPYWLTSDARFRREGNVLLEAQAFFAVVLLGPTLSPVSQCRQDMYEYIIQVYLLYHEANI